MEIQKYIDIVRRRFVVIVLTLIVTLTAVAIGTRRMTPVYQASTTLRVAMSATGSVQYSDYMYADRLMNTYVQIATGKPLQDEIVKQLGIRPVIKADIIANTELIKITVETTDPQTATQAANAVAAILIEQNNKLFIGGGKSLTEVLTDQMTLVQSDMEKSQKQYATLLAKTPPAPESIAVAQQLVELTQSNYSSLLQQLEQAKAREGIQASMITVVEPAAVPTLPSSPKELLNLGLGFLVGLIGGLGLALVFENLDTTLYTTSDIEAATKRVALARIPKGNKKQLSHLQRDFTPMAEAFRNLGTLLHQRHGADTGTALIVMSAQPSQGKSTVVFLLAAALAEFGKSVVVIDCDTRIPRLHTLFCLRNDCGLVDVLHGQATLEDALQGSCYEGVNVLTSGSPARHPSQMLSSPQMGRLVSRLKQRYDYVFLDSPALLAVADVAALRPYADLLILVVRRAHAKREALRRAGEFLDESTDKPVYLVVNHAESNNTYGYYQYRTKPEFLKGELREILKPSTKKEQHKETQPEPEQA